MHPVSPSSVSQADTLGTSPFHDQDTLKEVYASPDAHYLGTPINREPPPTSYYRSDDFPEVKPSEDLEVSHKPAKFAGGGYYAPHGGDGEGKIVVGRDEAPLPPTPAKDWKKSWNVRILLVIGGILIILAVILGAVLGSRAANKGSNGNDAGADGAATTSSGALATASSLTVTTIQTGSVTTTASVSPATKTLESVAIPEASAFDIGRSYNASFTRYGTNDGTGGSNCNVALNGCGFYSKVIRTAFSQCEVEGSPEYTDNPFSISLVMLPAYLKICTALAPVRARAQHAAPAGFSRHSEMLLATN